MRRTPLLNDGLWRCLCPSFDRVVLAGAAARGPVIARPTALRTTTRRRPWMRTQQSVAYSTAQERGVQTQEESVGSVGTQAENGSSTGEPRPAPSKKDIPAQGSPFDSMLSQRRGEAETQHQEGWFDTLPTLNTKPTKKKTRANEKQPKKGPRDLDSGTPGHESIPPEMHSTPVPNSEMHSMIFGAQDHEPIDERLLETAPPTEEVLAELSARQLGRALMQIRGLTVGDLGRSVPYIDYNKEAIGLPELDRYERIAQLVEHLVKKKGWPMDTFLFESMMDIMADPRGSAKGVRELLKSMETEYGLVTETMCRSAIVALSVHPDYVLRQYVLDRMKNYWYAIDRTLSQYILIAMLREGQVEMAYDLLIDSDWMKIDLWVFDVFVAVLGQKGFLDEMLMVLARRRNIRGQGRVPTSLTYYLLDVCSSASHHEGVVLGWSALVRGGMLKPSDGMLENVLATAAAAGDAELASEAFAMISQRGRMQVHHYEAMAESFARDGDVPAALKVLCIMEKGGLEVRREHTRAVLETLRSNKELPGKAETSLREMAKEEPVPLGVVAVVLEALCKTLGSRAAAGLYEDVELLTGRTPSAAMIQDMIAESMIRDKTHDYISDYKSLVPRDERPPARLPTVSGKLINKCLDSGHLGLALRFANSAAMVTEPRRSSKTGVDSAPAAPGWLRNLTTRAIEMEDRRIWILYDKFKREGDRVSVGAMQKVARLMRATKRMEERKSA